MATRNQTPEQKARDNLDTMLEQAGWKVQPKKKIDFNAGPGIYVIRHGLGVDLEEMVEAVEPSLKDHHRLKLKQLRSLLERSG